MTIHNFKSNSLSISRHPLQKNQSMPRPVISLVLTVLVVLGTVSVFGQSPDKSQKGFLAGLKEGQSIMLKEIAGRFEISSFDDGQAIISHKVIEVGTDYLTVEDFGGLFVTRIPVFSIKAVVLLKVPRK
jgi:hypothetical protein